MEAFLSKDINRKIVIENMDNPKNRTSAQNNKSAGIQNLNSEDKDKKGNESPVRNMDDTDVP